MGASSNRRTLVNLSVAASSAAVFAAAWVGVVGADEERAAQLAAEVQAASDLAVAASAAPASAGSAVVTVPAPSAAAVTATTAPATAAVQATPAPVKRVVVVRPSRAS